MLEFLSVRVATTGPLQVYVDVPLRAKRRGGRGLEDGLLPVDPQQPEDLSGGAASALHFGIGPAVSRNDQTGTVRAEPPQGTSVYRLVRR